MLSTQPDRSASPASADADAIQPLGFRLPIAKIERWGRHDWNASSACGQYEINIYSVYGRNLPGITHWGFETRVDSAGQRWTSTDSTFVTDNFGNLIEVPA